MKSKKNPSLEDWKDKLGKLTENIPLEKETIQPTIENEKKKIISHSQQTLRIELDKRNGKPATIISEYEGKEGEIKALTKTLKLKCGSGGSYRANEILIQGDFRLKIAEILKKMGYKTKNINF